MQLTLHLRELEKEEKTKPKVRRKEITRAGKEINKIGKNETKSWFFEKINKIDKCLARQRKKREDSNK